MKEKIIMADRGRIYILYPILSIDDLYEWDDPEFKTIVECFKAINPGADISKLIIDKCFDIESSITFSLAKSVVYFIEIYLGSSTIEIERKSYNKPIDKIANLLASMWSDADEYLIESSLYEYPLPDFVANKTSI